MEFEDQDEEHEEPEEDEDDDEEDAIPITGFDPLLPNSSAVRPLKMSTHTTVPGSGETRSSSSSSPPPSPLSLSIPPLIKKPAARYRECQKNHAVGIGGHAVDGCGEFMPAGAEGSIDALRCAACNCHRNFHRQEADPTPNNQQQVAPVAYYPHHQQRPPGRPIFQFQPVGYQRPLALPSPAGGRGGEEEREMMISNPMAAMGLGSSGRKRFRTKFTAEQKEKMLELAEKIGWRLQKQDEEAIQQFCHETGLKRKVLKVWMHNNKQTYLGKKP